MFLLKPNIRTLFVSRCSPFLRYASSGVNTHRDEIPVIRIPKYIDNSRGQTRYKEGKKTSKFEKIRSRKTHFDPKHSNKLLISSDGKKELNHYYGYRYDLERVPSISKEWLSQSSNGSQMTFHRFDDNPSVLQNNNVTFAELGLTPSMVNAVQRLVPDHPSLIQVGGIPQILQNRNVILSAETGSGKTIAYLAPLIQKIQEQKIFQNHNQNRHKTPFGLVLLPSRELTQQVGDVATNLAFLSSDSQDIKVGVATIVGGLPNGSDHSGMDLIVTTIGMVESHISRGVYNLSKLNHLVLDEADTLLDETFSPETMDLLNDIRFTAKDDPEGTQLICCSATMPKTLSSTIGTYLNLEDDIDKITTQNLHFLHPNVKHIFHRLNKYERDMKLIEILKENRKRPTIIFANRANSVSWIYHFLNENDIKCVRLTSQMDENERVHAFKLFQNYEIDILVSTDLGSRGLDTCRVSHVINYDCPHFVTDYIHRAGRTGRLGQEGGLGKVSSFVAFKPDVYMLMELEKAIRLGKTAFSEPNFARHDREDEKEKKNRKRGG